MSTTHLSASAPTDYWRKPPALDVSSAPKDLKTVSSSQFHRARVTVSAPWTRLYDQGGLLVFFPNKSGGKQFWLKTGIEYYNGQANLSTVSAREWADWSLLPLESDTVTVEIEREHVDREAGTGSSLWVYLVEGEKRTAVREVTWAFEEEGDVQVGVYAARPTKSDNETGEAIRVSFSNFSTE